MSLPIVGAILTAIFACTNLKPGWRTIVEPSPYFGALNREVVYKRDAAGPIYLPPRADGLPGHLGGFDSPEESESEATATATEDRL
eukprot:15005259-Alexandrium_andersonii.AAC.1